MRTRPCVRPLRFSLQKSPYRFQKVSVGVGKRENLAHSVTVKFRSIPTSLWPPPAKSSAPCACSEPWVHFRENFTKQKRKHSTRAAEAPDEKRARLQTDQARHSLARAAETPEQHQVRLQSQQVRQNASRVSETPEQRQSRLQEDQVNHRIARAIEIPIQHVVHHLGLRKQRNVAITLKWKAQMHDGFALP
ncbi:hypothetical protein TNCV_2037241 [Trichonephila clavipes]|nr:hypothetical protein TNCV_2037241 [Trichonephila clavipes]